MTPRRLFLALLFLWCLGIVITPFLHEAGPVGRDLAGFLTGRYGHVCHQFDSRSYHADGEKFPVCIRCMSIYLAFLAGALVCPFVLRRTRRELPARLFLAFAIAPMVIDVALDVLGLHASSGPTRLISGSWFGILAAITLVPDLERAMRILLTPPAFHKSSANYEAKT